MSVSVDVFFTYGEYGVSSKWRWSCSGQWVWNLNLNLNYKFTSQFEYCEVSVKNQWGRNQKAQFCSFSSLECFNCRWAGDFGVEQNILFNAGWSCVFCLPGFIQGWTTQGETNISSLYFWCSLRKWAGGVSSRFPCVNTGILRSSASC